MSLIINSSRCFHFHFRVQFIVVFASGGDAPVALTVEVVILEDAVFACIGA
jgi:hypothetical protein